MRSITFENLVHASKDELEELLVNGEPPDLDNLIGYDFQGYNFAAAADLIGTRKFFKGFYGTSGQRYAWGYNGKAEQGPFDAPWKPIVEDDGEPARWYFFKVLAAGEAKKPAYDNCVVVDYHASGEHCPIDPAGYTYDYVCHPDRENPDLL